LRPDAWRRRKTVDLFDFYDRCARQRSEVIDFGRAWRDMTDPAAAYSLHWIVDTGELYVLRIPDDAPHGYQLPNLVRVTSRWETEGLTAEVLDTIVERVEVEALLRGWEEYMPLPDSLMWVREAVAGRA
jgi:hypothetical protein